MNYLYIFEDGTFLLGKEPTEEDYLSADDNGLTIINMIDFTYFISKDNWQKIELLREDLWED